MQHYNNVWLAEERKVALIMVQIDVDWIEIARYKCLRKNVDVFAETLDCRIHFLFMTGPVFVSLFLAPSFSLLEIYLSCELCRLLYDMYISQFTIHTHVSNYVPNELLQRSNRNLHNTFYSACLNILLVCQHKKKHIMHHSWILSFLDICNVWISLELLPFTLLRLSTAHASKLWQFNLVWCMEKENWIM